MSYTAFSYGALTLSSLNISAGETCTARITVTNIGACDGEEVVQLYIHDLYSSVTVPERKLQDFQRIFLKRGEAKELVFVITPEMLSLLDEQLHEVVEAGDFEILIGSSSRAVSYTHLQDKTKTLTAWKGGKRKRAGRSQIQLLLMTLPAAAIILLYNYLPSFFYRLSMLLSLIHI